MLDTIASFEARVRKAKQRRKEAAKRTGIACPDCGSELAWMGESLRNNVEVKELARCLTSSCGFQTMIMRG